MTRPDPTKKRYRVGGLYRFVVAGLPVLPAYAACLHGVEQVLVDRWKDGDSIDRFLQDISVPGRTNSDLSGVFMCAQTVIVDFDLSEDNSLLVYVPIMLYDSALCVPASTLCWHNHLIEEVS